MGKKNGLVGHPGIPVGPHVEEFLVPPNFDADGVQATAGIDRAGREVPDPVPMSPPAGYVPPNDLMYMIQTMIERVRPVADAMDFDTEEEANDFDIEDDPLDPLTPYEAVLLPQVEPTPPTAAPSAPPSPAPGAAPSSASAKELTPAAAAASQTEPPAAAQAS